jgi:transcriptional regulator with XRE-family HTH domain
MDVRIRVGLNVQKARRARGVSQEELAHAAKIHQTYLSGVELGKRNPSILVLDRIAKALGLDVADLTKPQA